MKTAQPELPAIAAWSGPRPEFVPTRDPAATIDTWQTRGAVWRNVIACYPSGSLLPIEDSPDALPSRYPWEVQFDWPGAFTADLSDDPPHYSSWADRLANDPSLKIVPQPLKTDEDML